MHLHQLMAEDFVLLKAEWRVGRTLRFVERFRQYISMARPGYVVSNATISHCLRLFILIFTVLTGSAWAEGVMLEVQPSSIAVSPSDSDVQARVIFKNTTSATIRRPVLSPISNDGLKVELGAPSSQAAAPGQVIVWSVKVKDLRSSRIPGSVLFDATYQLKGSAPQHAFASLSINSQTDGVQKPIEVSVEGNFDSVSEQRPASGYLIVTNNLNIPVQMQVKPVDPQDNNIKLSSVSPFQVPARSVVQTKIEVQAQGRITPGKYPFLFELIAEWSWAGHNEQRRLVVSEQATVGVFFESELLKALGIPSFLVLPGCLALFTMQLFVTMGWFGLKNESRLPQLTVNSPGFWIIAITTSAVFAYIYGWITKNNYLIRYGFNDLRNVWFWSILIGGLVSIVYGWSTLKRRREHVPRTDDCPTDVLRKLSRNGLDIVVTEVRFRLNDTNLHGFLIERIEDGQTLVWVVPPILTDWGSTPDALAAEGLFRKNVDARHRPEELAQELEDAMRNGHVQVRWGSQGAIPNPFHLKVDAIFEYKQPGVIFG